MVTGFLLCQKQEIEKLNISKSCNKSRNIGKKTAGQEFSRPAFFMPVSV